MIAVLYVDPAGSYAGIPGLELWDETRDARLYDGPWPVVAHPPCARWSRLARFCEVRHGLKVGDDGGCFEAALRAVRTFGGVLEHPAYSKAWPAFGLPKPTTREGWTLTTEGASCYVEQGRYGLPVKKATWLYAFGVELPDLRWGYTPDNRGAIAPKQTWRGGMDAWRDVSGGYRKASSTPPAFRDALLSIARSALAPPEFEAEILTNLFSGEAVVQVRYRYGSPGERRHWSKFYLVPDPGETFESVASKLLPAIEAHRGR